MAEGSSPQRSAGQDSRSSPPRDGTSVMDAEANQSLSSDSHSTTSRVSVLRMAAHFEDPPGPKGAAAPKPSGKVAELVTSFDSKTSSPTTRSGPTTRAVLENSPWKSQGIGHSRVTKTSPTHSAHSKAHAASPTTAVSPGNESTPPRSTPPRPDHGANSSSTPSSVGSSGRPLSVTASPGATSPDRLESGNDRRIHSPPLGTPPRQSPARVLDKFLRAKSTQQQQQTASDSDAVSVDSGILERIRAFETGRAHQRHSNGAEDSHLSVPSHAVVDPEVSEAVPAAEPPLVTPTRHRSDPPAETRNKDPPAKSPLQTPNQREDATLSLDYSVTPSKLPQGFLTPSREAARKTWSSPVAQVAPEAQSIPETKHESAAGRNETNDHENHRTVLPGRLPKVNLFPRSGIQDYDLPTTPSRPDNSMDISSLQASPIIPADESFVTLEDGWRTNMVEASDAPGQSVPIEVHALDDNAGRRSAHSVVTDGAALPVGQPGLTSDTLEAFLASETPRTNNQSFASEASSSLCMQGGHAPPSIPKRLSSVTPANQQWNGRSSKQGSLPKEQRNQLHNQGDVTRIIAALERVIPYAKPPSQEKKMVSKMGGNQLNVSTDSTAAADSSREWSADDSRSSRSRVVQEHSMVSYDDGEEEDVFEGLEIEPGGEESVTENAVQVETIFRPAKAPLSRTAFSGAPSQTSSTTDIRSNRLHDKKLWSKVAIPSKHPGNDKSNPEGLVKHGRRHSKGGRNSFRTISEAGSPIRSDKLFQHIYADEYSSSDDSSCSSDGDTVQTGETPRTHGAKEKGFVKAFFDFLTFGEDESIYTMETESFVSSAVGTRLKSTKKHAVKSEYSPPAPELEPSVKPSFAFSDWLRFMDCQAGKDDLVQTTEQHLSEEYGISSVAETNDLVDEKDTEVESLVFDAAFFNNLWKEISTRPRQPAWNLRMCGAVDDAESVASGTEDLSPEEYKIFNAVFPPSTSSKTSRRKAAQVLSVCRQRFPSLYQNLVAQLDRKARQKKVARVSSPTQRISSPVSVLPPVQEEVTDNDGDDRISEKNADEVVGFPQSVLSSIQDTASSFLSAPSSTFGSDLLDGIGRTFTEVSEAIDAAAAAAAANRGDTPVSFSQNGGAASEIDSTHRTTESSVPLKNMGMCDETFSANQTETEGLLKVTAKRLEETFINAGVEERLVLNYDLGDKECKESETGDPDCAWKDEDESTYLVHYIDESSEHCFVTEVSRDESNDDDLIAEHAHNDPSLELAFLKDTSSGSETSPLWDITSPPCSEKEQVDLKLISMESEAANDKLTAPGNQRSASVLRPSHQGWEHFTPDRHGFSFQDTGIGEGNAELADYVEEGFDPEQSSIIETRPHDASQDDMDQSNITPTRSNVKGNPEPRSITGTHSDEDADHHGSGQIEPVTPTLAKSSINFEARQAHWEAFDFSYFEAAKEQELVATVKRNNSKKSAPKLKPSKFDQACSLSRTKRSSRTSVQRSDHNNKKSNSSINATNTSPTSVAPPKIRKLRVADLYPSGRLDFDEDSQFGAIKPSGTNSTV